MVDFKEIARQYAAQKGFDSVREAGERNGYKYFHIYNAANEGYKTGMPQFVRIYEDGSASLVENNKERMWALHQEVTINGFSR